MSHDPSDHTNIGWDYSEEETALLKAVDTYKRVHHCPYPTCRDVLNIIHDLGYQKTAQSTELPKVDKHGRPE